MTGWKKVPSQNMVGALKSFAKRRIASVLGDEELLAYFLKKRSRQLARQDAVYLKLAHQYGDVIKEGVAPRPEQGRSNITWSLWLQGAESAPDLVKTCWDSMRVHAPERNLVLLDLKNLHDYVEIPGYIMDKWERGEFSATHFSDIVRTELLCSRGGLWLDSTVLLTGGLPSYISDASLFVYKQLCLEGGGDCPTVASSWLISGKTNQHIMLLTRELLWSYWRDHDECLDYFLFHLFFAMSTRRYAEDWSCIPLHNNHSPHELLFELGSVYSQAKWDSLLESSTVHKLSYKVPYVSGDGTMYSHIVDDYASGLKKRLS